MLNELNNVVQLKIEKQNVAPMLKRISNNFILTPPKFHMDMINRTSQLDTKQDCPLEMSTNMVCNAVKIFNEAISYLYGENKKLKE